MIGCVSSVDKEVTSINNNKYFDTDLKTSPMCKSKVRIMSDQQHSRDLFLEFFDSKTPICLENVSPMKNDGKRFFNPKIGASYRPASPLDFQATGISSQKVSNCPYHQQEKDNRSRIQNPWREVRAGGIHKVPRSHNKQKSQMDITY